MFRMVKVLQLDRRWCRPRDGTPRGRAAGLRTEGSRPHRSPDRRARPCGSTCSSMAGTEAAAIRGRARCAVHVAGRERRSTSDTVARRHYVYIHEGPGSAIFQIRARLQEARSRSSAPADWFRVRRSPGDRAIRDGRAAAVVGRRNRLPRAPGRRNLMSNRPAGARRMGGRADHPKCARKLQAAYDSPAT